jgi:ubiquinone/menaquinone biosynthesis C-methylase UbiE
MGAMTRGHTSAQRFVPAAGHDWLLPFYDPLWRLLGGASHLEAFVQQAELQPGHRVLEIGCGTGNLTLIIKRLHPEVEIVGLDPDPKALARAARKAHRAGVSLQLDQGFSQELKYPDASFDRVFSSFMFHHLDRDTQAATLHEVRRVLQPGGSLHLVDFGGHAHGRLARLLHSSRALADEDQTLALMRQARFASAETLGQRPLLLGGITFYRAAKT